MHQMIGSKEVATLRQEIISQCTWSDTYSSLKHILKRTANQLPLLVSFSNVNDEQQSTYENCQTILFFDRNLSNKLLFTPLQQRSSQPELFDAYPNHCTFAITDAFRGLFEFVSNGKRCAQTFTNLEQLINFTSNFKCSIVFMSRDHAVGFFQDRNTSQWSSKTYDQGAIFRAERIHLSAVSTSDNQQIPNDYLECHDEDGYTILIKLNQIGRYSIISTSTEQSNHPELYLHSTQTPNISQLMKTFRFYHDSKNNNNCIRLVRGPVPYNFHCQYFHFIRQHRHDVLVGLTQEGLVIEWNLDSHITCRYATNLNDILNNIYGTIMEQTLESYIDQARTHYREHFQYDMQLISTRDWTAFFQYWKWNGSIQQKLQDENTITYQSRHRFHLVASIQDLSDNYQKIISAYKKSHKHSQNSNSSIDNKIIIQPKQRSFLAHMSKLISTPKQHSKRSSQSILQGSGIGLLPNDLKPFDDSIYDSNQIRSVSSKDTPTNQSIQKTKRSKSMK